MPGSRIRVTHVITDLDVGGAELSLYRLLSRSNRQRFRHEVISLIGDGAVANRIRELGVPVVEAGANRIASIPKMVCSLAARIGRTRPDIVHTWLYHSDLLGGLAAKLFSSAKIVWHIHHNDLTPPLIKPRTRHIARACARLSRFIPDKIVFCSKAGMETHTAFGYDAGRMLAIPNGFDLEEFCPSDKRRAQVRVDLGIPPSSVAIGLIGRFSPLKDHETFLAACGIIRELHPDTIFVLCGDGITPENELLMKSARQAGVVDSCRLLGRRENVPEILAAIDIVVSSSRTEAFPCAIGEAMAMEIPCVVTDVGDSALVVGDTGRVVAPGDPAALAEACSGLIRMGEAERRRLGRRARERVRQEFSLPSVVERVETLYSQLCMAAETEMPFAALERGAARDTQ